MVMASAPGVFIKETEPAPQISGVATSITAFVGRAWRGPVDLPVSIASYADYERQFGGLWQESPLSYALQQFFDNGGTQAIIVRVATRAGATAAKAATIALAAGETFRAANPGSWGLNLAISISMPPAQPDPRVFDLTITDAAATKRDALGRGGSGLTEQFLGVSVDPANARYVTKVLEQGSSLLRVDGGLHAVAPAAQGNVGAQDGSGTDGAAIGSLEVTDDANRDAKTGLYALDGVDLFNLLCIPPYAPAVDLDAALDWTPTAQYCEQRRAFLIVDAPAAWTVADAQSHFGAFAMPARANAALYFPRVLAPDPLDGDQPAAFAPCGFVAGVMSRNDAQRGVWQAPAGISASLTGAAGLSIDGGPGDITDAVNGSLNALGINCLRVMPTHGTVVWGARTLAGSDSEGSPWKYVPVRRLTLYIEESVNRGTEWAVLEPNAAPTWARITASITAFLDQLFHQGALQGEKASDAYFVRCDATTTTQADIDNGEMNIIVGFAAVRPAEFVIVTIEQLTQQPPS